jgi:hypothetical protein
MRLVTLQAESLDFQVAVFVPQESLAIPYLMMRMQKARFFEIR